MDQRHEVGSLSPFNDHPGIPTLFPNESRQTNNTSPLIFCSMKQEKKKKKKATSSLWFHGRPRQALRPAFLGLEPSPHWGRPFGVQGRVGLRPSDWAQFRFPGAPGPAPPPPERIPASRWGRNLSALGVLVRLPLPPPRPAHTHVPCLPLSSRPAVPGSSLWADPFVFPSPAHCQRRGGRAVPQGAEAGHPGPEPSRVTAGGAHLGSEPGWRWELRRPHGVSVRTRWWHMPWGSDPGQQLGTFQQPSLVWKPTGVGLKAKIHS